MFSGVFALAMFMQAGPPPADQPLKASWNTSPQGAGSSRVPAASDPRDGWEVHDLVGRHDWLRFAYINGVPCLLLNTAGKVVYSLQGTFTVTNTTPMPWSIEFTATDTGGTGWGTPLVVTITVN